MRLPQQPDQENPLEKVVRDLEITQMNMIQRQSQLLNQQSDMHVYIYQSKAEMA
jgi:hypothetical protein